MCRGIRVGQELIPCTLGIRPYPARDRAVLHTKEGHRILLGGRRRRSTFVEVFFVTPSHGPFGSDRFALLWSLDARQGDSVVLRVTVRIESITITRMRHSRC